MFTAFLNSNSSKLGKTECKEHSPTKLGIGQVRLTNGIFQVEYFSDVYENILE